MRVIENGTIRRVIKTTIPFVIIPTTVALGTYLFDGRYYFALSVLVAAMSLLLFYSGFEKAHIGSRRLVIVSVMIALSVAGRFIPLIKPVAALTVLTAVYLGSESGFLVGSLSALISNMYFGQGPWTPYQMLAWGMIGLIAGFLASPLKKNRSLLILYGAVAGVLYSIIMDVFTVLWYNGSYNPGLYWAALITALPYTILYTLSNILFLLWFAKPFGEKFERIRIKYGV